ncbi:MAG TPA: zf-HC2 domain-containing protein [Myxococcaceae bacterium]|jgi:anti-sigma factor RsiW
MSLVCREQELDALLAGELSPAEAERVRAHAESCAACQHSLSWLKLERGWMTQRARRSTGRPALDFSAVQARLAAKSAPLPRPVRAAPQRTHWSQRGMLAMGAAAAVAFLLFGGGQPVSPAHYSVEEAWSSQEVLVSSLPPACMDLSGEAVAATEDRFGACLIATPALP